MLILGRRVDESIYIDGKRIRIVVTSIEPRRSDRSAQVKIGIEAPQDVSVWREELYDKVFGTEDE